MLFDKDNPFEEFSRMDFNIFDILIDFSILIIIEMASFKDIPDPKSKDSLWANII